MEKVKFTTLNEIVANGTDKGTSNKVVAVAAIIKAFTKNVKMVVEGVPAAYAAYELAKKSGIDMPIVNATYAVLKGEKKGLPEW